MRVDVTGRHVEITAPLRTLITQRLAKLERVLNDNALSAHVILTKEKYRHRTEMVIHARGDHMMRGLGEGNAWPASVRQAAEKARRPAAGIRCRRGASRPRVTRPVTARPRIDSLCKEGRNNRSFQLPAASFQLGGREPGAGSW